MVRGLFKGCTVSHVSFVPLRDPQFSATPVLASDVIHAQSKDLPRIFRVNAQGRRDLTSISLPVLTLSCLSASHFTSTCCLSIATMGLPHFKLAISCFV